MRKPLSLGLSLGLLTTLVASLPTHASPTGTFGSWVQVASIEATGAPGGNDINWSASGGSGCTALFSIPVASGDVLSYELGTPGEDGSPTGALGGAGFAGGGSGGRGGALLNGHYTSFHAAGGGGATRVQLNGQTVAIAAGGGGAVALQSGGTCNTNNTADTAQVVSGQVAVLGSYGTVGTTPVLGPGGFALGEDFSAVDSGKGADGQDTGSYFPGGGGGGGYIGGASGAASTSFGSAASPGAAGISLLPATAGLVPSMTLGWIRSSAGVTTRTVDFTVPSSLSAAAGDSLTYDFDGTFDGGGLEQVGMSGLSTLYSSVGAVARWTLTGQKPQGLYFNQTTGALFGVIDPAEYPGDYPLMLTGQVLSGNGEVIASSAKDVTVTVLPAVTVTSPAPTTTAPTATPTVTQTPTPTASSSSASPTATVTPSTPSPTTPIATTAPAPYSPAPSTTSSTPTAPTTSRPTPRPTERVLHCSVAANRALGFGNASAALARQQVAFLKAMAGNSCRASIKIVGYVQQSAKASNAQRISLARANAAATLIRRQNPYAQVTVVAGGRSTSRFCKALLNRCVVITRQ